MKKEERLIDKNAKNAMSLNYCLSLLWLDWEKTASRAEAEAEVEEANEVEEKCTNRLSDRVINTNTRI